MKNRPFHFTLFAVLMALMSIPACKEKSTEAAAGEHTGSAGAETPVEKDAAADKVQLTSEAIQRYGVGVEPVARHLLIATLSAPARVSFNTEAMAHVGSPLRGRITELKAKLGDTVKKGDALLVVESPELGEAQSDYMQKRAAAQSAVPAAELAKNAHDRARTLYDKSQGIALSEVQKREMEYRAAQAAMLAAQTSATGAENKLHLFGMDQGAIELLVSSGEVSPRFSITAPIAGQVVQREVTLGELVSPDREALMILADMSTLWVLADVPEARLADCAVGASARVTVGTGAGATIAGRVGLVSAVVDASTRSAQVRIEVPARDERSAPTPPTTATPTPALRPGMFAQVEIEAMAAGDDQVAPVLAIPEESIQTIEGRPAVFVPVSGEQGMFVMRHVKVGRVCSGLAPVFSGLKEGERIVVTGSFILKAELGKGSAGEE